MKTAEFLNTKENYMLQVLPEHAGDDPESGLVKVPDWADTLAGHSSGDCCYFWDHKSMKYIGVGESLSRFPDWEDIDRTAKQWLEHFECDSGFSILWQRNKLQQKVDEVRKHLGITSNDKLSIMIGRESSYLRKLLKRNASTKTKEKVIAELDALISSQVSAGKSSGGSIDKPLEIASNKSTDDNYVQLLRKYKDWKNTSMALLFGFIIAILALASVPFWLLS